MQDPSPGPTVRDILRTASAVYEVKNHLSPRQSKAFVHAMPFADLVQVYEDSHGSVLSSAT